MRRDASPFGRGFWGSLKEEYRRDEDRALGERRQRGKPGRRADGAFEKYAGRRSKFGRIRRPASTMCVKRRSCGALRRRLTEREGRLPPSDAGAVCRRGRTSEVEGGHTAPAGGAITG